MAFSHDNEITKLISNRSTELEFGDRMIDAKLKNTALPNISEELVATSPDGAKIVSPLHLGVDGCRGGWLGIAIGNTDEWRAGVYASLEQLAADLTPWSAMLVDMPIGLPEGTRRACDGAARKLLGRRASSVFPVPCRPVLAAKDYREACAINREHLGVALSKQSWNLLPKIRELDDWLRSSPNGRCREAHPELAFLSLNGGVPLLDGKRSAAGRELRRALLERYFPPTGDVLDDLRRRFPAQSFALDDVLDALVLAVAARLGPNRLIRLPEMTENDRLGLPMEIVFPAPIEPHRC